MDTYSIVIIIGIVIVLLVLFLATRKSKGDKERSSDSGIKGGTAHTDNL